MKRSRNTILFAMILSCSLFLPYRGFMLLRTLRDAQGPLFRIGDEDTLWMLYDIASFIFLMAILFLLLRYRKRGQPHLLLLTVLLCAVSIDSYFYLPHIAFCIHLYFHAGKYASRHELPGLGRSAILMLQVLFTLVVVLRLWLISPGFSAFDTDTPILHFALELSPWLACLVFLGLSILRQELWSLRLAGVFYTVGCILDAFLLKSPIILLSPQFILAVYLAGTWNRDIEPRPR